MDPKQMTTLTPCGLTEHVDVSLALFADRSTLHVLTYYMKVRIDTIDRDKTVSKLPRYTKALLPRILSRDCCSCLEDVLGRATHASYDTDTSICYQRPARLIFAYYAVDSGDRRTAFTNVAEHCDLILRYLRVVSIASRRSVDHDGERNATWSISQPFPIKSKLSSDKPSWSR